MGGIGYLIISTLIGAAVIYFACDLEDSDKKEGKGNSGCVVALVISLLFSLILGGMALIGK